MIARRDYAGPMTKSAEAMFARALRQAKRLAPQSDRAPRDARSLSPIRKALNDLGLAMTTIRHWEDAGIIGFKRANGRRIVDQDAIDCLATVIQLRRAGLTIRQIREISDTLPPPLSAMRLALQTR